METTLLIITAILFTGFMTVSLWLLKQLDRLEKMGYYKKK